MTKMLQRARPPLEPIWTDDDATTRCSDDSPTENSGPHKRQGVIMVGANDTSSATTTALVTPTDTCTFHELAPRRHMLKVTTSCCATPGTGELLYDLRRTRSQSPMHTMSMPSLPQGAKPTMRLARRQKPASSRPSSLTSPCTTQNTESPQFARHSTPTISRGSRNLSISSFSDESSVSLNSDISAKHDALSPLVGTRDVLADSDELLMITLLPEPGTHDKSTQSESDDDNDDRRAFEERLLRTQEQRDNAVSETSSLQRCIADLEAAHKAEVARLEESLASVSRKLQVEYELRTTAETKCALMECELAELSSHIQFEAQNLVAQERREHKDEVERLARKQSEIVQLMDMEREQVASLKKSLESVNNLLDSERREAERVRSELAHVERKLAAHSPTSSAQDSGVSESGGALMAAAQTASCVRTTAGSPVTSHAGIHVSLSSSAFAVAERPEPHVASVVYFGNDSTRTDARLGEFLGFINVSTDKEAMHSPFVQRCMREDVEPTLAADCAPGITLTGWQKHRKLLHAVQDSTLILESFSPQHALKMLSLGCYLCSGSVNQPADQKHRSWMFRMRLNDSDENKPICNHCHYRMVSVCSFFSYLKIVRRGLIKKPVSDIWLEVSKIRLQMWIARSGASPGSHVTVKYV